MSNGKRGQIAIFLMLLIAGLVLMLALNVEVFTAARAKLRLQNAADASAIALTRWQGITLNLIGDLNLAHIKAINDRVPADAASTNFIAGITALQRHLSAIGPLAGFKAANDLAAENGASRSERMATATDLIAQNTDALYYGMVRKIMAHGVYAGIDNAKMPDDLILTSAFYDAISSRDYVTLCRLGGMNHTLPQAPDKVPSLDELVSSGCFGFIGANQSSLSGTSDFLAYELLELARNFTLDSVTPENLLTNRDLIVSSDPRFYWATYDSGEWENGLPAYLRPGRFPWLNGLEVKHEHAVMGGSATIRLEESVTTSQNDTRNVGSLKELGEKNISSNTYVNTIVAEAGAKVFANRGGKNVLESSINPPLILPTFTSVRLVPYQFAANNRSDTANEDHIKAFPRKDSGQLSKYQKLLDLYHSEEFQKQAAQWYLTHDHSVFCVPPSSGNTTGGGSPHGN